MTPLEFFRDAPFGSKVRYGPHYPVVTVHFIVRNGTMYAHGTEEETNRQVFLILEGQRLRDANRGYFDSVEIVA
ncbi:hypothetical protein C4556_00405 [Candidatus Parcubacteria bacterium]|nr:MAG: hypothetical protein C4556_00405 [Candidatus Parcubacteria bacterium]